MEKREVNSCTNTSIEKRRKMANEMRKRRENVEEKKKLSN